MQIYQQKLRTVAVCMQQQVFIFFSFSYVIRFRWNFVQNEIKVQYIIIVYNQSYTFLTSIEINIANTVD